MAGGGRESKEPSFQLITKLDPGYVKANDLTFSLFISSLWLFISAAHTVGI